MGYPCHSLAVDEDGAVDEEVNFEPGDILGKALVLVNQIRASSQAKAFFAKCCHEEKIAVIELIKWVRTRWGSMHDLVDRLIEC
ncbi:hypothetical protein CPC08DRAFT_769238 [Agrocybe pediades]|nr:hypothetical protein CPC08DRAFT_769238 [Agrocybe pediades]